MAITEKELYTVAINTANNLPGAEVYDFVTNWEAARVNGKWFLLTTVLNDEKIVTLKAAPEDGIALRQMYPEISTGYHMNKRHWITVRAGDSITAELLRELITDSYLTVVEKLPNAQRPLGWERYLPDTVK